MSCIIELANSKYPHNPALIGEKRRLSYAELFSQVQRQQRELEGGQRLGQVLSLRCSDPIKDTIFIFAALRAGFSVCPLNPRLPESDIQLRETFISKHSCRANCIVLWTSGSLGQAKAAVLSHQNLVFNALGSNENICLNADSGWVLSLPLFHVSGLGVLYRSFLAGAAVIIPNLNSNIEQQVSSNLATHASLVPTQLYRLLQSKFPSGRKLTCLLGGGFFNPNLIEQASTRGLNLHSSYGLTEMGSQVTCTSAHCSLDDLRTSGSLLNHRKLQIAADGEILVSGDCRFQGYLGAKELEPGDWHPTGDIGMIDQNNLLRIFGRKDTRFKCSGEIVYPEEIENALTGIPGVETAIVTSVPDAELENRPVAAISQTGHFNPEKLTAILRETLPAYKLPREYRFLPTNAVNLKPSRAEVAKLFS